MTFNSCYFLRVDNLKIDICVILFVPMFAEIYLLKIDSMENTW